MPHSAVFKDPTRQDISHAEPYCTRSFVCLAANSMRCALVIVESIFLRIALHINIIGRAELQKRQATFLPATTARLRDL